MKKLKDFNLNVISDQNALTVNGGCGNETSFYMVTPGDWVFNAREYGDWEDTGCC